MWITKLIKEILFPVYCIGCGKEGMYICQNCLNKIPSFPYSLCPKCLRPYRSGGLCPNCQKSKFPISRLIVAASYKNEIVSQLVRKFKFYPFAIELSKPLGILLSKAIKQSNTLSYLRKHRFILVPVPLFFKDKAERGFNQSEELAKVVSQELELPLKTNLIRKNKKTKPQVGLKAKERKKNLKQSFIAKKPISGNFLLIDDIITTGATLKEVAQTLRQAGANEIWAAVLAKA